MFFHLFINRLKIVLRDRTLVFWTLIFPVLLGTLFYMGFSNIIENEQFQDISIAVVDTKNYQQDVYFQETLKAVSEGENKLFNVTILTEEQAKEQLQKKEITGYILDNTWLVQEEGMEQTIVKTFLDRYLQRKSTIENILEIKQGNLTKEEIAGLIQSEEYIDLTTYSKENPDYTVNYFYSLIAMACLYGGFWGIKEIKDIQANQSKRAARINLAPVHKLKTILYNFLASFTINFIFIMILLVYLIFILGIDFGTNIPFVILVCFVGCLIGILMGMAIGVVVKKGEQLKLSILLAVTMTGAFLSGMMYQDMKYIVQTTVPILGYINPCNLLTDALYALYYYDTYNRFILNMSILGGIGVALLTIVYYTIRRQKYESI